MPLPRNWLLTLKWVLVALGLAAVGLQLLTSRDYIRAMECAFLVAAGFYFIFAFLGRKEIYTGGSIVSANDSNLLRVPLLCLGILLYLGGIVRLFI